MRANGYAEVQFPLSKSQSDLRTVPFGTMHLTGTALTIFKCLWGPIFARAKNFIGGRKRSPRYCSTQRGFHASLLIKKLAH